MWSALGWEMPGLLPDQFTVTGFKYGVYYGLLLDWTFTMCAGTTTKKVKSY